MALELRLHDTPGGFYSRESNYFPRAVAGARSLTSTSCNYNDVCLAAGSKWWRRHEIENSKPRLVNWMCRLIVSFVLPKRKFFVRRTTTSSRKVRGEDLLRTEEEGLRTGKKVGKSAPLYLLRETA